MSAHLQEYLDYIANTGGGPTLEQFDDDWEPIGPLVRLELKAALLTVERAGRIYNAHAELDIPAPTEVAAEVEQPK